jgi:hypothetical protein
MSKANQVAGSNHLTDRRYWVKDFDKDICLLIKGTGRTDGNGSRIEGIVVRNVTDHPDYPEGTSQWFNTLCVSDAS